MGARGKILGPLILLAGLAGAANLAHASAAAAARVSHREGSLVVAPAGATEWSVAGPGQVVIGGDRLWTDPGARAEVHLGGAMLHMDSEAFLEVADLGGGLFLGHLHEGALLARVRTLAPNDQLEIGTPHFSIRLLRAGDYRIDVDPGRGTSRADGPRRPRVRAGQQGPGRRRARIAPARMDRERAEAGAGGGRCAGCVRALGRAPPPSRRASARIPCAARAAPERPRHAASG